MATRVSGPKGNQSNTGILWTLLGGIALTALYLLVLDWAVLIQWVKAMSSRF